MIERKWAVFGVLVLLVLVSFIVANKFWFYPHYTAQIQASVPYVPPDATITAVLIKPFEGTLRKIIEQPESEAGNRESVGDKQHRNPFLWKDELKPPPTERQNAQLQPVEIPRLGMIIIGDKGKTAMLDDTLVHPGEAYGGHVIEDIESEYVILSGGYGVLRISMLENSFGPPQVDILETTDPNLLIQPVFSEKKRPNPR